MFHSDNNRSCAAWYKVHCSSHSFDHLFLHNMQRKMKHTEICADVLGLANWLCPHIATPASLQGLSSQDDHCKKTWWLSEYSTIPQYNIIFTHWHVSITKSSITHQWYYGYPRPTTHPLYQSLHNYYSECTIRVYLTYLKWRTTNWLEDNTIIPILLCKLPFPIPCSTSIFLLTLES